MLWRGRWADRPSACRPPEWGAWTIFSIFRFRSPKPILPGQAGRLAAGRTVLSGGIRAFAHPDNLWSPLAPARRLRSGGGGPEIALSATHAHRAAPWGASSRVSRPMSVTKRSEVRLLIARSGWRRKIFKRPLQFGFVHALPKPSVSISKGGPFLRQGRGPDRPTASAHVIRACSRRPSSGHRPPD